MDVINVQEIQKAHAKFKQTLDDTVQDGLRKLGNRVLLKCSESTDFQGTRLKNSVRFKKLSKYTIRTHTALNHASFLNDGTPPHVIKPRRAKALRFVVDGAVRFAGKVNHPGTQATHWFDKANKKAFDEVSEELTRDLERIAF